MRKVTQASVRDALIRELSLKDPEFRLRSSPDGRISGHIVSETFKGKRDHERQDMIHGALERSLGSDSLRRIGLLLAYTPEEWHLDEELIPVVKSRKRSAGRLTGACCMPMTVEIEQEVDGRWIAEVPELPGALVYGASRQEAIAKVQALALRIIADRIEHGEPLPELDTVFAVPA